MTRSGHQEAVARLGAMRLYGDIREGDLAVHCSETAGLSVIAGGYHNILVMVAETGPATRFFVHAHFPIFAEKG